MENQDFYKSDFYFNLSSLAKSLDALMSEPVIDRREERILMSQLGIAKSALQCITGKTYVFRRTDKHFSISNKADPDDYIVKIIR